MSQDKPAKTLQPSRLVVDRQELGDKVIAALETHAEAVGRGFERDFAELDGDKPDMTRFVALAKLRLAAVRDAMVEADLAHQRELSDDRGPRAARDKADEALRAAITEVQEMTTGMFGAATVGAFKLSGTPPTDVRALVGPFDDDPCSRAAAAGSPSACGTPPSTRCTPRRRTSPVTSRWTARRRTTTPPRTASGR